MDIVHINLDPTSLLGNGDIHLLISEGWGTVKKTKKRDWRQ